MVCIYTHMDYAIRGEIYQVMQNKSEILLFEGVSKIKIVIIIMKHGIVHGEQLNRARERERETETE